MTKEEKLKELIETLFIDYKIKLYSNVSPKKKHEAFLTKNDEWFIAYDAVGLYTLINYKLIWLVFKKKYNMTDKDIHKFLKTELKILMKLKYIQNKNFIFL